MANNIRKLRVAFLLTPSQLAARMCADAIDIERIEDESYVPTDEWIDAVASALGVPASAVTDPDADIDALRAAGVETAPTSSTLCPVAARYAILAVVAKFGGLKLANSLDEDALSRAIQNFNKFIEDGGELGPPERASRQKLALRITVLAILQSRAVATRPRFEAALEEALQGATAMIRRFSTIGP